MGDDVRGRAITIIGIGHVGSRVAELCGGLFQMRVLAFDPYLSGDEVGTRGAEKVGSLNELPRPPDYVSVNCPHTAATRCMLGAAQFARMQPHAYFISTARGGIHDETAPAAKQIAGAGLDEWEDEPPPTEPALLRFDNFLVSPHAAGIARRSRHNIARIAAE
jgi:D-3-phosphoglycerate dehydrogenase / 2-oxoglutarate reductase